MGPQRKAIETPGQRKYAWAQSVITDTTSTSTSPLLPSLEPPPWEQPTIEQLQSRNAFQLAKTKHSRMVSNNFSKQWQTSWETYRSTKPNPANALTSPLSKARLRIHEGLAKAESSLATQIRTEKIGLAAFLHRQCVPTVTSPACPCGWRRQTAKHVIMFCPLYDVGSRGSVGAPSNHNKLVNTARGLKNITSRLIKTGLVAQFSVAAEQLYVRSIVGNTGSTHQPRAHRECLEEVLV